MTPYKQPQIKNRQYAKYAKKALLSIVAVASVMVLSYAISILLFGTITEKFSKFALGVAITILIGVWASELFQDKNKRLSSRKKLFDDESFLIGGFMSEGFRSRY